MGIAKVAHVMAKLPGHRIEAIQSATIRPDPQRTQLIFNDRPDGIVRQTVSINRIVLIAREAPGSPIKLVQPAAIGANPQSAPLDLQ